ncbi:MAG: ABC transporter permease [Acholeplasmataceae bacterium]|nr:ABC transporter permease [Acholeplasmataceae bacterium]
MLNKEALRLYIDAFYETLYIVGITGLFVLLFGFIIGFTLYMTQNSYLMKQTKTIKATHRVIATINDIFRSIPFIILLIMMIPVTRFLVGTMLGPKAAIPALIISATPFFARVVHMSLFEVSNDTIEAVRSMGGSFKYLLYVIFKEALPSLISGFTLTLVTLIGFMSAAAVIGAGGLAFLAYEYGKFGSNYPLMYLSIFTILALVFIIQIIGDKISRKLDHK